MIRVHNFRPAGKAGSWFSIKNVAVDTAEVSIYDEIGRWGVTASDFVGDLQGVDAKKISLRINSPGGDVFDGLAILNALRNHPAEVNVIVDGLAASAASFIAMAGDSLVMAPNSMMMIHEASGVCMGNATDMRELADLLDKTSANIADIYSRRSGRTADEHRKAMKAETWYTDQEAVDAGLADSVLGDVTDKTLPEVLATAMAVHHTGTEDSAWDGGAAEKSYPNQASTLSKVYAWKNADGDPNQKSTYKFPHHHKAGGPANLPACRNGLARLDGANIPEADRAGVKAHLQAHLNDAKQSDQVSWDDIDLDLEAIRQALKGAS